MTDLGLESIQEAKQGLETLGSYRSRTRDGRYLKCNAAVLKDAHKNIIGFMCINIDIGRLLEQAEALDAFCLNGPPEQNRAEKFRYDLGSILHDIIKDIVRKGRTPVHNLSKSDRLSIIAKLDRRGVF
jgi:predicted transcriptional regulator YheO